MGSTQLPGTGCVGRCVFRAREYFCECSPCVMSSGMRALVILLACGVAQAAPLFSWLTRSSDKGKSLEASTESSTANLSDSSSTSIVNLTDSSGNIQSWASEWSTSTEVDATMTDVLLEVVDEIRAMDVANVILGMAGLVDTETAPIEIDLDVQKNPGARLAGPFSLLKADFPKQALTFTPCESFTNHCAW